MPDQFFYRKFKFCPNHHHHLTYSDEHKDSQKVNKTKQSLSKNNQSSKRFRLQNIDEYIFIAFRKFHGKIIFHGLPYFEQFNKFKNYKSYL